MEWYIPWWFQYTQYRRRQWTSIYLFLLFFHITRGNFTSRDTRRLTWEMKIMSVSSSSISLYSCFLFVLPQRLKTLLIIPISSISNCQSKTSSVRINNHSNNSHVTFGHITLLWACLLHYLKPCPVFFALFIQPWWYKLLFDPRWPNMYAPLTYAENDTPQRVQL